MRKYADSIMSRLKIAEKYIYRDEDWEEYQKELKAMDEIEEIDVEELPECPFTGIQCHHVDRVSDAWCNACLLGQLIREVRLLSVRQG